jgi:hypothetical protein
MKTSKLFLGSSLIFSTIILFSATQGVFAGISSDTWTGGSGSSDNWSDAANWQPGSTNAPPLANDALFFDGNTRTSPNNDFTAGTAFDGITFNNAAGAFTLGGNSVLLSGNISGITMGVTNNSSSAQMVNLDLALDWGYHTFMSPSAALNLNGALAANLAGVADFGTVNVGSTSLTTDGTGLISGLGGAGLIGNNGLGSANSAGGFSGLATISSGSIAPYTYSGAQS